MSIFKTFLSTSPWEKILISFLSLVIFVSLFQIGNKFYLAHSETKPAAGGIFIEGVTAGFRFLNPVLAQTDLDRDVMSLISCSLTRFNPLSNSIEDYAADHTLSLDQRTYTFRLKENIFWHDGQPVTADDVVFTFQKVIQNQNFPNPALAKDFFDVLITKIDPRTVTMTIKKKYAFFIFNTTVGLLPKHILGETAPSDLLASEFNLQPIGCGPYQIKEVTNRHIKLIANKQYFQRVPFIEAVIFRIFNAAEELAQNIDIVSGTKDFSPQTLAALKNDARLKLNDFALPQYVALFFNTDQEILSDPKTRLGLQLATNKKALLEKLPIPAQIIDNPLLEIAKNDWKYQFDASRADGALFEAGWRYPNLAKNLTEPTPTEPEFITKPSRERFFATAQPDFYLAGSAPANSQKILVNGYQLSRFQPNDPNWNYRAALEIKTLKIGENEFRLENEKGEFDRITIFYSPAEKARQTWLTQKTKKPSPPKVLVDNSKLRFRGEEPLILKLLVLERENFIFTAEEIVKQWRQRGVKLILEILPERDFVKRMQTRDYDLILSGQNLGYNLDAYSFWHSSEARLNGENLSNLKSSAVNAWLEQIRASFDTKVRRKRLANLRVVLSEEVPAIMLYSPIYSYAIDNKIQNFNLGQIALKRDRLAGLENWYFWEKRVATEKFRFGNFVNWFWQETLKF